MLCSPRFICQGGTTDPPGPNIARPASSVYKFTGNLHYWSRPRLCSQDPGPLNGHFGGFDLVCAMLLCVLHSLLCPPPPPRFALNTIENIRT